MKRELLPSVIVILLACHGGPAVAQTSGDEDGTGPGAAAPAGDAAAPADRRPDTDKNARRTRPRWIPGYPGPWDAELHAATSSDGLKFKPTGKAGIRFASAPALARLPDDRIVAVFEYYSRKRRHHFGALASAHSTDGGKTWSDPQPLRIRGLSRRAGPPRGPALAVRPDGRLQLVFVCTNRRGRHSVYAAMSRDGASFRFTGQLKFDRAGLTIEDVAMLYIDSTYHLFGTISDTAGQRYHGVSRSGRRFKQLDNLHTADVGTQGCAIAAAEGCRIYASTPAGIMSAMSKDGEAWRREEGLRLAGSSDPAVIRLDDEGYLMLYVKGPRTARGRHRPARDRQEQPADEEPVHIGEEPDVYEQPIMENWYDDDTMALAEVYDAALDQLSPVEEPDDGGAEDADIAASPDGRAEDGDLLAPGEEPPPNAATDDASGEDEAPHNEVADTPEAEGKADSIPPDDPRDDEAADVHEQEYTDEGVPVPDFHNRVDYRAWLAQSHDPASVEDNAYDHYAAFMLDADGKGRDISMLPSFQCMFNDAAFQGSPAPWDPNDHPEWEESYHATADLVAQFIEAASHRDYLRPLLMGNPSTGADPTSDNAENPHDPLLDDLLINFLLPDLSGHRRMVKQTLSRAWRAPGGKPDPEAMLDAFEAALGSADHIGRGDFIIETLVGIAEQALVERNARWALDHDVFSPEQLQTALDLLVEKDRPLPDPSTWAAGELASSLDITQYLFGPVEPGREPRLNPQRLQDLNSSFGVEGGFFDSPAEEDIASLSAEDVVENFVEYYREYADMTRRGYPEVTAQDLTDLTDRYVDDNIVSRAMIPSLSRAYQLATRHEASRRATQLTYAIHLHKAETGQWPQSLDDLPPRYADLARTDPFSGRDFAYRVTGDGFTLYSASENGIDDGGTHHRRWGDRKTDGDETDDHVFWPTQKR